MRFPHKFLTRLGFVFAVFTAWLGMSSPAYAFDHPGGFHTAEQIQSIRQKVANNEEPWLSAWHQLIDKADAGLNEAPSAVTYFDVPEAYQNPTAHKEAKALLREDVEAVYATALAYAIGADMTQDKRNRYAEKTAQILNDWAQTNTGFGGPDGALVMSYTSPPMIWAAELIWNYPGWTDGQRNDFKGWAKEILYRAANIKNRKFPTSPNNWNDWGVLTALSVDHLTDDTQAMNEDMDLLKRLIDIQIRQDGGLPRELARGEKSAFYTAFALEAMTAAIEIVRHSGGPDLFTWNPPSGGTVYDALVFRFDRFIEDPGLWPEGNQAIKPFVGQELYQTMGLVYGEQKWLDWVDAPVFAGGTGLAFIAPTLTQPMPLDDVGNAPPSEPHNLRLIRAAR